MSKDLATTSTKVPIRARKRDVSTMEKRIAKLIGPAGKVNFLAYSILSMVAHRNYEHALREMDFFFEMKSEYPELAFITERYVERAKEMIEAIKTKRDAPGDVHSMARRQEASDHLIRYFEIL